MEAQGSSAPSNDTKFYVVQKGDTLVSISLKVDAPIGRLMRLNKSVLVGGSNVFEGMRLSIQIDDADRYKGISSVTVNGDNNSRPVIKEQTGASETQSFLSSITKSVFTSLPTFRRSRSNTVDDSNPNLSEETVSSAFSSGINIAFIPGSANDDEDRDAISDTSRPSLSRADSFEDLSPAPRESIYLPAPVSPHIPSAPVEQWELTEPVILGEASLLTVDIAKKLRVKLPRTLQIENFVLLYSLQQHGTEMSTFYRRTKDISYSIILIQTFSSEVFGGFTGTMWTPMTEFYGSGESFIFKIEEDSSISDYRWTGESDFFQFSTHTDVAMGGGVGEDLGFGFVLDADFKTVATYPTETYGNPPLSRQRENKVTNVEVFGFESEVKRVKQRRGSSTSMKR